MQFYQKVLMAAVLVMFSATASMAQYKSKEEFVEVCKTQGGGPKYCECMAKVTEETVGLNGEKAAESDAQTKMAQRIQECVPLAGQ